MRARVLRFDPSEPEDFEKSLNAFLEKATPTRIESVTFLPPANELCGTLATAVVFYSDHEKNLSADCSKARPTQVCAQCRKNPPLAGLKVCEACRDYQRDYRKKRKAEKKRVYP